MSIPLRAFLAVLLLTSAPAAFAAAAGTASANDYTQDQNWLCRPGRADACSTPTSATLIEADGTRLKVEYAVRTDAAIDCFYVYPTVSPQQTANSDMSTTGVEEATATAQFARFASQCRPFAPRYRQVTVAGLRAALSGKGEFPDVALAYQDVVDAWHRYVAHDNHGRGFVLIGHSQGAKILARLIAEEIDGKPLQAQLVSAIIPGTLVEVPPRADVGGTFSHVRLCATASDTGCVIAYSTYLASAPTVPDARYGVATSADRVAACVDPSRLAGSAFLSSDFPGRLVAGTLTTFVEQPGSLRGECVMRGNRSFLAISVVDGVNSQQIAAGLNAVQARRPDWGLHVLDVSLVLGNLVAVVAAQSSSWDAHAAARSPAQ